MTDSLTTIEPVSESCSHLVLVKMTTSKGANSLDWNLRVYDKLDYSSTQCGNTSSSSSRASDLNQYDGIRIVEKTFAGVEPKHGYCDTISPKPTDNRSDKTAFVKYLSTWISPRAASIKIQAFESDVDFDHECLPLNKAVISKIMDLDLNRLRVLELQDIHIDVDFCAAIPVSKLRHLYLNNCSCPHSDSLHPPSFLNLKRMMYLEKLEVSIGGYYSGIDCPSSLKKLIVRCPKSRLEQSSESLKVSTPNFDASLSNELEFVELNVDPGFNGHLNFYPPSQACIKVFKCDGVSGRIFLDKADHDWDTQLNEVSVPSEDYRFYETHGDGSKWIPRFKEKRPGIKITYTKNSSPNDTSRS